MAPTPHDALVHAILSQPEHAAAELAAVLPPSMLQHLDLSSLATLPGTFIDEELRDRHADLLFTVRQRKGASALIYILFEHQSSFDAWMPLRLLAYQLRIWESWRREHPDAAQLPPIVPVVLHHGTRPWPGSREFADLLDLDDAARGDFAEQSVRFKFLLDDLACSTDDELRVRRMGAAARAALFVLKHARGSADFLDRLVRFGSVLGEALRAPGGPDAVALALRYLFEVRDDRAEVRRAFAAAAEPALEGSAVTIADQLREEGRIEGLEMGSIEGRRMMLRAQLAQRFGPLTQSATERINAASATALDCFALRLLDAHSLDEALKDPAA